MEFLNFFFIVLFSIFFGCSMYGWSNIQLFKKKSELISINIVLGMSTTLVIGGVLNIFNLSNSVFINLILFLGFTFFLIFKFKNNQNKYLFKFKKIEKKFLFLFSVPIFLLLIHIISAVEIDIYNYHDDLQKYFVHPLKMLQTGSVFGSTLSSIGRETLGGQAFFQSFYINWFGIQSINIFDSVFCLSIICLIIIEISIKQGVQLFGILISTLIILIHPQLVNVTSFYSTILFILALILIILELLNFNEKYAFSSLKNILPLCFIIVSLTLLKTSNLLFLFIFFTTFFLLLIFFKLFNKSTIKEFFSIFLLSIFLIFPWLIFFIKQYLFNNNFTNSHIDQTKFNINFDLPNIISIEPLFLGGTLFHYSSLILTAIIIVLLIVFDLIKKKYPLKVSQKQILTVGFSSILSSFFIFLVILFLISPNLLYLSDLIRYTLPFIIACAPLGLLIVYPFIVDKISYLKNYIIFIIFIISIFFAPLFVERIHQTYKCGSQLSFTQLACSKEFIEYSKFALSENKKNEILNLQNNIPKDEPIMIWINTPFFLDFKRNKIIEIDNAGVDNNWAIFPSAKYMILEHNTFPTRSIKDLKYFQINGPLIERRYAIRALENLQKIRNLYRQKKLQIIFNNKNYSIFKILE